MDLKTRAGISPVETKPKFKITTQGAEEFLQKKFNSIISGMKKNGENVDDIKIMLITARCSKKFLPFMLLLPTSVLKDGKGKQNNDEPDIFQNDHSERYAQMKNGFFKLIQAYMYTKDDEKAFFSTSWRQELNVSLKTSHMLKANRIPKVQKMNKGKNTFVVCMIDPVRLFHDMLQDLNNKDQKFKVKIVETEKRDSSNYVYNIERLIVDGKKNRDKNMEETIAYEISQRLGQ